jgi:digeranylgeranylglycerophospholipid reductase
MKCDVLVVGAGPAGSMAAKTTAENDVDVVIIERNKYIGQPVRCAEGINKFLFKDTGVKKNDSFIEQEIIGTKIYFYDEIYLLDTGQWQGYTINRKVFDPYLAQQAESAGAQLFTETKAIGMEKKGNKWVVKTKSKKGLTSIETNIVIGADGFECYIGRWAGIRKNWKQNEFSKCYEFEIECPHLVENNLFHIAFGEEFPNGYAWVFPKKNTANVGVGVTPKANPKKALDFFIKNYPRINLLLGKDYSIKEKRGGSIPITGPRDINELVTDGIILTGDAAGMVDPITGEGICSSMLSGIAAGETAAASLKEKKWDKKQLSVYQYNWMHKKYIDTTLGENFNSLLQLKDIFSNTFSSRTIQKKTRQEFISMILNSF